MTTVPSGSAATIGTTAKTELGSDSRTARPWAVVALTCANVLGQRSTTLSPARSKRNNRAGATYGSPAAGPKPPKPVDGTDDSMKSAPSCAPDKTKYGAPAFIAIGIRPGCIVTPADQVEYAAGACAAAAAQA